MRKLIARISIATGVILFSFCARADDTPPHIDTSGANLQPAYPASAMQNKERGTILLGAGVTAAGTVNEVDLLKTSGFADLDAAAISGVMDWHFVPAMKDGTVISGNTKLAIGFRPPDAISSAQTDLPEPKSDFLPPMLSLNAPANDTYAIDRTIPCSIGGIRAWVEMQRPNNGFSDSIPSLSIVIRKNGDAATLVQTDQHVYLRLLHGPSVVSEQTYPYRSGGYMKIALMPVSIAWDRTGLVSARVANNTYQVQLPATPTELSFTSSSATAIFYNSVMACFAASPPPLLLPPPFGKGWD